VFGSVEFVDLCVVWATRLILMLAGGVVLAQLRVGFSINVEASRGYSSHISQDVFTSVWVGGRLVFRVVFGLCSWSSVVWGSVSVVSVLDRFSVN
jgi:hypothetical protein